MKTGVIYQYTNKVTGQVYIGQSTDMKGRIRTHRWNALNDRYDTYFYRAMRKYGEDAFSVEILEECPQALLNDKEKFWIEEKNSLAPNGYNIEEGGQVYEMSDETRKKISDARQGIQFSDEHIENLRKSHIGNFHTESTKLKISEKNKGRPKRPEELEKIREHAAGRRLPIARYSSKGNLKVVYESVKEAASALGMYTGHIVECCKGKRKARKYLGDDFLKYYIDAD